MIVIPVYVPAHQPGPFDHFGLVFQQPKPKSASESKWKLFGFRDFSARGNQPKDQAALSYSLIKQPTKITLPPAIGGLMKLFGGPSSYKLDTVGLELPVFGSQPFGPHNPWRLGAGAGIYIATPGGSSLQFGGGLVGGPGQKGLRDVPYVGLTIKGS